MNAKRKQSNDRRNLLVVLGFLLCVLPCSSSFSERGEYKVVEKGNQLEINSPWGKKTYTAQTRLDVMKNYRIAIPIKDLMPVGAEENWDDWYDPDDWFDSDAAAKLEEAGPGADRDRAGPRRYRLGGTRRSGIRRARANRVRGGNL